MTPKEYAEHDLAAIFSPYPVGFVSTEKAIQQFREDFAANFEMLVGVAEAASSHPRESWVITILEGWHSVPGADNSLPIVSLVQMLKDLPDTVLRRMAIITMLGPTWRMIPVAPLYTTLFPRYSVAQTKTSKAK